MDSAMIAIAGGIILAAFIMFVALPIVLIAIGVVGLFLAAMLNGLKNCK